MLPNTHDQNSYGRPLKGTAKNRVKLSAKDKKYTNDIKYKRVHFLCGYQICIEKTPVFQQQ
jgi:hypothetical protein